MACGVPVAAYPVTGPIDVIEDGVTGALDQDSGAAAMRALEVEPGACRARALRSGWDISSRQFENNLVPCRDGVRRPTQGDSAEVDLGLKIRA
jgi:glycosyltransferase involved in cell wall biosynthesis